MTSATVTERKIPANAATSTEAARLDFSSRFFAAVLQRDATTIRAMANLAGAEAWTEAVRPLSDFLLPPSPRWRTPRKRKRKWKEARASAAWALGMLAHPGAYAALVRTMACDPELDVRAVATSAVQHLGGAIAPYLVDALRDEIDWDVGGIRSLLECLGETSGRNPVDCIERRAASAALMDVLYESLPRPPRRWARPARKIFRPVACLVTFLVTIGLHRSGWSLVPALIISLMPGQLAGALMTMVATTLLVAGRGRSERKQLYSVAAGSLARLNDKRAIPGLLLLAVEAPFRAPGIQARSVLLSLLPQITSADLAIFSAADVEIMSAASARSLGPDLMLALLQALEAVGNRSSVPRMQILAKRSRFGEIRTTAERAVQVIEAREARLQMSLSLLRSAPAPLTSPGELLRPATSLCSLPGHLLRAIRADSSG